MRLINNDIIFEDELGKNQIPYDKVTIFATFGYDINENILNKMTQLKWIHIFQTGIEHLSIPEILNRNILLSHTKDVHGIPMSEHVLSMILYTVRDIPRYMSSKQARFWDRREPRIGEAYGKTVSIFGTGSIGSDIAKSLKALNMHIIGVNRSGNMRPHFDEVYKITDKHTVLEKSDFIVLIMPATEETHHCIGIEEFKKMKDSAFLINIGRSSLIDTDALVDSLLHRKIKGAALDVFDIEPLPEDSILWDLKNIYITPHIASSTNKYNERCIDVFRDNYQRHRDEKSLIYEITSKNNY